MINDNLGDRMKNNYENRAKTFLTRRTPVIIRLDGKAFHTLTKGMVKPFDKDFIECMRSTGEHLAKEIQGVKAVYIQSDEISLLLTDYDKLTTDAWFNYNIQKMVSVSASICSVIFNDLLTIHFKFMDTLAVFDSRVFNIPKEEVTNYFIWRQKDWMRNSLSMLCQANFSHKKLQGLNREQQHEILHTKNINWADLDSHLKNGTLFLFENGNWVEKNIEISKNRDVIENLINFEE